MKQTCFFKDSLSYEELQDREEYAYIRNQFVSLKDANVNIMTHAFLFGTAIYEGLRGYYNEKEDQIYIFRLDEHYERMKQNCNILKIDTFISAEKMANITVELIKKNNFRDDCYIRPIAYKSGLHFGLNLLDKNDFAILAVEQKRFHDNAKPMTVCISSWRRIEDNAIPARGKINGAYVNSALAASEAVSRGYDDAIFLNENGSVSEGSGMNILMVRDNVVITPTVTDNILEGITRRTLLEIIPQDLKLKVQERSISRSELYMADEVIFCGTGVDIVPIKSIDNRIIGDGKNYPISKMIQELYFDLVRGKNKKRTNWLTQVY